MNSDWELYQEQVLQAREELHNKVAAHRAKMARIYDSAVVLEGDVQDAPGQELAIIEDRMTDLAVTGNLVAEAKFDDKVHKVLSEVIEDTRDDPGHAKSVQYRHVAERKLQRAVEILEEAL